MHSLHFIYLFIYLFFTTDCGGCYHKTNITLRFRETRVVEKGQIAPCRKNEHLHLHDGATKRRRSERLEVFDLAGIEQFLVSRKGN